MLSDTVPDAPAIDRTKTSTAVDQDGSIVIPMRLRNQKAYIYLRARAWGCLCVCACVCVTSILFNFDRAIESCRMNNDNPRCIHYNKNTKSIDSDSQDIVATKHPEFHWICTYNYIRYLFIQSTPQLYMSFFMIPSSKIASSCLLLKPEDII